MKNVLPFYISSHFTLGSNQIDENDTGNQIRDTSNKCFEYYIIEWGCERIAYIHLQLWNELKVF